jgi:hypothetical protein
MRRCERKIGSLPTVYDPLEVGYGRIVGGFREG